ncbi:MAG: hypothetical protein IV100_25490 [Myxococcales bacterium]|nr:hypothetical protein [Myxococcales bacterium]
MTLHHRRLGSTALRSTLAGFALAATVQVGTGCSPLYRNRPTAEPFSPASRNSDLIFVRTGDRHYYYVIDPKRQLCFFHSPLYGRDHMVQLDCGQFPDYERIVAGAEARRSGTSAPELNGPGDVEPDPTGTPTEAPEAAPLPPTGAPAETPDEAEGRVYDAFRRAYVQVQCGRREKDEEPLELILSRFQLDQETWQAHLDAAKDDEATWADLQTEVDRTCPTQ